VHEDVSLVPDVAEENLLVSNEIALSAKAHEDVA